MRGAVGGGEKICADEKREAVFDLLGEEEVQESNGS